MQQETDDEASYYEVEAILDKKTSANGTNEYLIKWKNYDESWYNRSL